jgi:hypothetical protein
VVLYLEGRAVEGSSLQIQFQKQGVKPIRIGLKVDSNGEWVFGEKIPLEAGDWEARVRMVEGEYTSEWSNPRMFKTVSSSITLGKVNIKFTALSLIIVILLLIGISAGGFFLWKIHRLNAVILVKEVREAESSVRGGISELRNDVLDELKSFVESDKGLTSNEFMKKEYILRKLDRLLRKVCSVRLKILKKKFNYSKLFQSVISEIMGCR